MSVWYFPIGLAAIFYLVQVGLRVIFKAGLVTGSAYDRVWPYALVMLVPGAVFMTLAFVVRALA